MPRKTGAGGGGGSPPTFGRAPKQALAAATGGGGGRAALKSLPNGTKANDNNNGKASKKAGGKPSKAAGAAKLPSFAADATLESMTTAAAAAAVVGAEAGWGSPSAQQWPLSLQEQQQQHQLQPIRERTGSSLHDLDAEDKRKAGPVPPSHYPLHLLSALCFRRQAAVLYHP